jgi:hypothetical protein
MAYPLGKGCNWNMQLIVYIAGGLLFNICGRQLHLDDVRPELSRDVRGVTDHVDRGFAFLI